MIRSHRLIAPTLRHRSPRWSRPAAAGPRAGARPGWPREGRPTTRAYREAAQGRGRSIDAVTPHVFIAKWRASELKERSASQEHFLDLCLLGEPTPTEADPSGEAYCFERGARKGHGRRRLGRRLEAALLRVGVQGAARGPRRRLRPTPVVLAGAGETAAADRLRHGAVPDPHELDEQRQPDA